MSARYLRTLQLEACHMRHVVLQTAVSNISGDTSGGFGLSACNRCNGIATQGCTISGCHTTKGTGNKTCATTETHSGSAVNNSIPDIGVRIEFGSKARYKTTHAAIGCTTGKDACGILHTAAQACESLSSHKHLHTHTGTGLGHIHTDGTQIAVKTLRTLQVSQGTEHPEKF